METDIVEVNQVVEDGEVPVKRGRGRKVDVVEDVVEEVVIEEPTAPPPPMFKLNYRRPNGMIRSDISKSIVYTLNVCWSDLIRSIPSDRWVTVGEIVELVRIYENSYPSKTMIRTIKSIEDGINVLLDSGVLLRR